MAKKPIKLKAIVHTEVGARYTSLVKPDLLKKAARATLINSASKNVSNSRS
jgi:hypothetical protein